MNITDIDRETEGTFFRCLHDEAPENPEIIEARHRWFELFRPRGLRAKVLINDDGEVAGLAQYLPIEYSPFVGKNMLAILCMWVHGYDHHIGNQQTRGYGRAMLEYIEQDARESGFAGVAAWGKDFPYWNPVSFFEHMGYRRADQDGMNVLAYKVFSESREVAPPTIRRRTPPAKCHEPGKVMLTAFQCSWCSGAYTVRARQAAAETSDICELEWINDLVFLPSISPTVFIDGVAYRPDAPPFTVEELKVDIRKRYEQKNA